MDNMEITVARRLTDGGWYTITGRKLYIDGGFEYYIIGEGDINTALTANEHLHELLSKNQE